MARFHITTLAILVLTCSSASGDIIHLDPVPPSDLFELDHGSYYTWGVDRPWGSGQQVLAAALTFSNITPLDVGEPNVLHVRLLDDAALGVTEAADIQPNGDDLDGHGIILTIFLDLPADGQTTWYNFTHAEVDVLNSYAADGRFALGFDPDADFSTDGISTDVYTQPVPEPSGMILLSAGTLVLVRRRRTRLRSGE